MNKEEQEARIELARIGKLIYDRNYNFSLDGNLSYRLLDNTILITPSGSHYGFIQPEDFVVIDLDGNLLQGEKRASSEYRLHVHIYKKRSDIRSIIHTHSPYALAASLLGIDLLNTYISVAPVPTTKYARIASPESVVVLDPYIEKYNWAIIPRHGVVTWTDSIWNSFLRLEGLEYYARVMVIAKSAGQIEPFSSEHRDELLTFWGLNHLKPDLP